MKARSKILTKAVALVLLAALTLMLSISAAAASSTTLTTTVPETVILTLKIQGKGTVTIGDANYTQSGSIQIPRNTQLYLGITPADGYFVKTVTFKGENMTGDVQDGTLLLPAIGEDASLCVIFSEVASSPITGDSRYFTPIGLLWLMAFSLAGIIVLQSYKKKNTL